MSGANHTHSNTTSASPRACGGARPAVSPTMAARQPTTTKGERARQPAPRCSRQSVCSRVIKSGSYEAHSLGTVTFGRGLEVFPIFVSGQGEEITLPRPNYPPDRFAKQSVGGFHAVSLVSHSRSEPFV